MLRPELSQPVSKSRSAGFQRRGLAGFLLLAAAWGLSWSNLRPWSEWGFFPLWLGYILTVDALVRFLGRRSPLQIGWLGVIRLFATSAALWWVFEALNLRVNNWHYLQPEPVGALRFILESSLDFSTVLPAIFVTAALVASFVPSFQRTLPRIALNRVAIMFWLAVGVAAVVLPLLSPGYFYPFVWVGLFFIVDPVNAALSRPSLLAAASRRIWWPAVLLGCSGLICGFFWEMWNSLSMPKWFYTVPHVPNGRLFEMPYPGYLGYIPFAMECFAVYVFTLTLLNDSDAYEFLVTQAV